MALLHGAQVTQALIGALRTAGIDLFRWKGLTVLRTWPRPPRQPNSLKQIAWRKAFQGFVRAYNELPPAERTKWKNWARPRGMTARTLFFKTRLKAWKLRNARWV
jgi:hypothetical protein